MRVWKCVATASVVLAACGGSSGRASTAAGLSPAQVQVAKTVAFQEAYGASPDHPGVLVTPSTSVDRPTPWPAYVTHVEAIATTHSDALQYVFSGGMQDSTPVVVVELTGDFVELTTGPANPDGTSSSHHQRGSMMIAVADASSGQVLDFGIMATSDKNPKLADATVLYDG